MSCFLQYTVSLSPLSLILRSFFPSLHYLSAPLFAQILQTTGFSLFSFFPFCWCLVTDLSFFSILWLATLIIFLPWHHKALFYGMYNYYRDSKRVCIRHIQGLVSWGITDKTPIHTGYSPTSLIFLSSFSYHTDYKESICFSLCVFASVRQVSWIQFILSDLLFDPYHQVFSYNWGQQGHIFNIIVGNMGLLMIW